jgi:hypothetical protein
VTFSTVDMATEKLAHGGFLAKIDLAAAYRSIPIHHSNYCFTGLRWRFDGDEQMSYIIDSRLPFGAAKSCQIFQRISDAVARMMDRRGMSVITYIDDMLCVADTELDCLLSFNTLIELLEELGLDINWKKVSLPCQKIVFLGVEMDSVSRKLTLPPKKLIELCQLVKTWTKKRRATKLELQQFIGKLNWACRVVRGGRTFLRRLQDLTCKVLESNHHIRLNVAARHDISWWDTCLLDFHGSCSFSCDVIAPSFVFASDACLEGGGAHLLGDWFYVNWVVDFPSFVGAHINVL